MKTHLVIAIRLKWEHPNLKPPFHVHLKSLQLFQTSSKSRMPKMHWHVFSPFQTLSLMASITLSFHAKSHNWQGCLAHLGSSNVTSWSCCPLTWMYLTQDEMQEMMKKGKHGWLSGWEMNNCRCSTKLGLITHVIEFKSMTWPRKHLLMASDKPTRWVLWVWNPITCSCLSTLGSIQHECCESQIMPRPSSWKTCETRKFMMVGNVPRGQPTFFTMPKGSWSSCCTTWDTCPIAKMASTIKLLGHSTKWYVRCNNSNGVMLVHNHYNRCAWNRTNATSTKMGWPN